MTPRTLVLCLLLALSRGSLAQVFSGSSTSSAPAEVNSQRCSQECFFGPNMDNCVDFLANMLTYPSPIPTEDRVGSFHYVADMVELCFTGNSASANGFYSVVALKPYASSQALLGQFMSWECTNIYGSQSSAYNSGIGSPANPQISFLGNIGGPRYSPNVPPTDDKCTCTVGGPYAKYTRQSTPKTSTLSGYTSYWSTFPTPTSIQSAANSWIPYTDTFSPVDTTKVVGGYVKPISALQISRTQDGSPFPSITLRSVDPRVANSLSGILNLPGASGVSWSQPDTTTLQSSDFSFYPIYQADAPPVRMWFDIGFQTGPSNGGVDDVRNFGPTSSCIAWKYVGAIQQTAAQHACMANCVPAFYWSTYSGGASAPRVAPSRTSMWCDAPKNSQRDHSDRQGVVGYGLCPTDANGVPCSGRGTCLSNALCKCPIKYGGRACETLIPAYPYKCADFDPCSGTGTCVDPNPGDLAPSCSCYVGWRGSTGEGNNVMSKVYANSFADETCTDPIGDLPVNLYMQDHQCLFWTSTNATLADGYLTHSPLILSASGLWKDSFVRPIWWISSTDTQAAALASVPNAIYTTNQIKILTRGYPCRDGRYIPSRVTGKLDNTLYGGPGCLPCPPCVDGQGDCRSDNSSAFTTNRVCVCKPNFVSPPKLIRYCTSCLNPNCATGPNRASSVTYPPLKYAPGISVSWNIFMNPIQVYYIVKYNSDNPGILGNADAWLPQGGLFFGGTTTDWNIYTWLPDYGQGFGATYIRPAAAADICQYVDQKLVQLRFSESDPATGLSVTPNFIDQTNLTCSLQQCPQLSSDSAPCGSPLRGTCNPMVNFDNPRPCGGTNPNRCTGTCTCYDGWTNGPANACEIQACPASLSGNKYVICGGTFATDANPLDNLCPVGSTATTCAQNHAVLCDETGNPSGGVTPPCAPGWIMNNAGKCTPPYANITVNGDSAFVASQFPGVCRCQKGWIADATGSCTLVGCAIAPNGLECNGLVVHGAWALPGGTSICDRGVNGGAAQCRCYLARDPSFLSAQTSSSYFGPDCSIPYNSTTSPAPCQDPATNTLCGGSTQGNCYNPGFTLSCGGACANPTAPPSCSCLSGFHGQYCTGSMCYPGSIVTAQAACTKAGTNTGGLGTTGTCTAYCGAGVPCTSTPTSWNCVCGVADAANNYVPCSSSRQSPTCAVFRNDDLFCGTNLLNCTYYDPLSAAYTLCNNVPGACTPTSDSRNFACTNCGVAYSGSRCNIQVGCGGVCNSTGGLCVNVTSGASSTFCSCYPYFKGTNCDVLTCDGAYNTTSHVCNCGSNAVYSAAALGCIKTCAFSNGVECGSVNILSSTTRCNSTKNGVYTRISSPNPVACDCAFPTPTAADPARPDRARFTVPWFPTANGSCEPYCMNGGTWTGSSCNCQNVPSGSSPWGGPRCNVTQCYNGGNYNAGTGTCTCVDNKPGVRFPWSNTSLCQLSVCGPQGSYYPPSRWCSCLAPYQESGNPDSPLCVDPCQPGGVANLATTPGTCSCDSTHTGTYCNTTLCKGGAEDAGNGVCACPQGMTWDATGGLCKQIPCTNGFQDPDTGACVCYGLWAGSACNIDKCLNFSSHAIGSGSNWSCQCDPGYAKSSTAPTALCTIPLCGGPSVGIASPCSTCGSLNYACTCASGYFASSGTCLPLDCGHGRVVGTQCACFTGWNATTPGGSCTVSTCSILPQRFYNVSTAVCECAWPWLNSTGCTTYACGTGGIGLAPHLLLPGTDISPAFYSCRCGSGYRLDFATQLCLANCDPKGTALNGQYDNSCRCNPGYSDSLCSTFTAVPTTMVTTSSSSSVVQETGFIVGVSVGCAVVVGAGAIVLFWWLRKHGSLYKPV